MKYLIAPTFAVICSTVGCAYGCHASGMPISDVVIAAALAASVSSVAAFGAVLLAHLRRAAPVRSVRLR
jgi:hypothetical protein